MKRGAAPIGIQADEARLQASYRRALALHRQGQLDAAERFYRSILVRRPDSFHALHMLGVLFGQRDDWAEAERLIARAIRADPGVAAAHANRGNALRLLDRLDEAMASYDRALSLQPDNTRALKGRGVILWQTGRREEALACYEHLLQIEPDYADGWIMKAAVLDHLKRNQEAIACYRRALDFDGITDPDKLRYLMAALGSSDGVPAAAPLDYVRDLYDKYALRFEHHLVSTLNYRGPELLAAQLAPLVPAQPLDVLDLGCGTGLCGPVLKPWARSLTGVDLSPRMLDEARRKRVYDQLVADEITAWLAVQDAGFDLIVASDVFIYFGDLGPVFRAVHRALRPAGLFAFSTEADEGSESRLHESLRYAHSAAYLERLAAETGWQVESLTREVLRDEERRRVPANLAVLRRAG